MAKSFGVGHGGQGTWLNNHFETEAEAMEFYNREVLRTQGCYGKLKISVYVSTPEQLAKSGLLARTSIVNIKRDGSKGQLRQTLQVYRIDENSRHHV